MQNRTPKAGRTKKSGRPVTAEPAGESALPPAHFASAEAAAAADIPLSRRGFFAVAGGALALGALSACGGGGGGGKGGGGGVEVFALSGRGRRISNAAKRHNANKRFLTSLAADTNRAHPGDDSFIVRLTLGRGEFERLFDGRNVVADLRNA